MKTEYRCFRATMVYRQSSHFEKNLASSIRNFEQAQPFKYKTEIHRTFQDKSILYKLYQYEALFQSNG